MARVASPASALRAFALSLPGAHEDFPWGERVAKVGKKVFAFLGTAEGNKGLSLSVKLPRSSFEALELPFAEATGYGLGKAGWVTATFEGADAIPVALLTAWIDESYRAVAPKKLVAELDARAEKRPSRPRVRRPGRR